MATETLTLVAAMTAKRNVVDGIFGRDYVKFMVVECFDMLSRVAEIVEFAERVRDA